jgi:hypothetical protein
MLPGPSTRGLSATSADRGVSPGPVFCETTALECLWPHALQANDSSLVGTPADRPSRAIDLNRESQATPINAVQSTADHELLTFANGRVVADTDVSAYRGLAINEMVLHSLEARSLDEADHAGRGEHDVGEMSSRHLFGYGISRLVPDAHDQRLFHPRILAWWHWWADQSEIAWHERSPNFPTVRCLYG